MLDGADGLTSRVSTVEFPEDQLVDRASVELASSDEISGTRANIPTCSITLPAQPSVVRYAADKMNLM